MKRIIKGMFFNLRMGFAIKLFSFKKSSGYYSRMKDALVGLKKMVIVDQKNITLTKK